MANTMTLKKLYEIKEKYMPSIDIRRGMQKNNLYQIMVCGGTGCHSCESAEVLHAFNTSIQNHKLKNVSAMAVGCLGLCAMGPMVIVYPEGTVYCHVTVNDVEEIITSHIINGVAVERLFVDDNGDKKRYKKDIEFYKNQVHIARKDNDLLSIDNMIYDYIALDGYKALYKCLTSLSDKNIIEIVTNSGLRGRGGAGFPTGKKWQMGNEAVGKTKYVICNGDEGDPGAFMDRSIMESNPHSIIEAMIIAGYAIGAHTGYVYLRAEYPLAQERMQKAIDDAYNLGLLGADIFGTGFSFDLSIKRGAGAFVCGEETALLHSIEGKRGEPTTKPPYPTTSGLFGCPTVINNVETLACIPHIILLGDKWFSSIGTEYSKGTKVFALTGKIKHSMLVELPMGTTIREIVYKIGGGLIDPTKKLKCVQMGGPSGGCIPADLIDVPIDYKSLTDMGAMMGSGGMIVMDEDTCMVDMSRFFLDFTCSESCGKCNPCRIGTAKIKSILEKITRGEGTTSDIDELYRLCDYVKKNSLCGLGQTSPNPVLSALKYFKDEFMEHVVEKKCRAGVCKNMSKYEITDKCIGCSACSRMCPVGAISGEIRKKFTIDQEKCIKCGACFKTCKFGAIKH